MVDVMCARQRSALMSRVRGKHTRPEMQVRKLLRHQGFRYRLHGPKLPGRSDVVFAALTTGCRRTRLLLLLLRGMPALSPARDSSRFLARKAHRESGTRSKVGSRASRAPLARGVVWEFAVRLDQASVGGQPDAVAAQRQQGTGDFRDTGQVIYRAPIGPERRRGLLGCHEASKVRLAAEDRI